MGSERPWVVGFELDGQRYDVWAVAGDPPGAVLAAAKTLARDPRSPRVESFDSVTVEPFPERPTPQTEPSDVSEGRTGARPPGRAVGPTDGGRRMRTDKPEGRDLPDVGDWTLEVDDHTAGRIGRVVGYREGIHGWEPELGSHPVINLPHRPASHGIDLDAALAIVRRLNAAPQTEPSDVSD